MRTEQRNCGPLLDARKIVLERGRNLALRVLLHFTFAIDVSVYVRIPGCSRQISTRFFARSEESKSYFGSVCKS